MENIKKLFHFIHKPKNVYFHENWIDENSRMGTIKVPGKICKVCGKILERENVTPAGNFSLEESTDKWEI